MAVFLLAASVTAIASPLVLLLDACVNGTEIFTCGERGTILRSTDDGETWTAAKVDARSTLTGITFGSAEQGWAVGHDALILHTADGGATWQHQFQLERRDESFLDVVAFSADRVLALGAFGIAYLTTDGGANWEQITISPDGFHHNRGTLGPDGTLFVAGEAGTLMISGDAGASWTPLDSPYEGSFYGLCPLPDGGLLAYGLRGHIYRHDASSDHWTDVKTDFHTLIASIVRLPNGYFVAAGSGRQILVSVDDAHSFQAASLPPFAATAELLVTPSGRLLSFGEAGVVPITLPVAP